MQQHLFEFEERELARSVFQWEHSESDKGQIYTRSDVVEFMLDLSGLADSIDLKKLRILEPSCGAGEFVLAIARRLVSSATSKPKISDLYDKVLAYELVGESLDQAKDAVRAFLVAQGYKTSLVTPLLDNWFRKGDFLLDPIDGAFSHIVGNPPYVRVENIPKHLLAEYRRRYISMGDRADLYVPFFEKSLGLLKDEGVLCFICTDRWTKNTYGRHLRKIISDSFALDAFVDLYGSDSFATKVSTYPAITKLRKSETKGQKTAVSHNPELTAISAKYIEDLLHGKPQKTREGFQVRKDVIDGDRPWLIAASDELALIRKLERKFPTLEEAGCLVQIGAATGNNKVYIVEGNVRGIEESRLLPVITADELRKDAIEWKGRYIINTYDDNGVIDLDQYPGLKRYLEAHKSELAGRHVAKNAPTKWYKTIDRVYPKRAAKAKLLIPDIKSRPVILYDKGVYHPNNSIYFITSDSWNLHALKAVLMSGIAKLFVEIYTTKISNGYLRFQAQHLRKIRLPRWQDVDPNVREKLIGAGRSGNYESSSHYTALMYGLSESERQLVGDC